MPHHHLSQDGHSCVPDDRKGCGILQNPFYTDPFCGTFPIAEAIDPNEKNGPLGLGSDHFVRAGDAFGYQIEFENQPTANAAAQTVTVTDPLDTTKYDLSTFQLGPISFGKYLLTPSPGLKNYTAALDLRPDANVTVVVRAGMDSSTGVVTWSFASLDPATMKTVTDPFAGFLPPNTTSPAGIGHVLFSISPLASLGGDAKICNSASIVFDVNAAIQTDPFCNSKDTIAPATKVEALGSTQSTTTFHVAWAGTDAGVGIDTYTIYVSDNGGAFAPWETMTTSTGASYTGSVGHTYGFYSVASDKLGNVETKTVADTTTTIGTAPAPNAALNPSSVAFGGVTVGSTAAAKIVTLSNTGNAPLAISSISLGGPNASVFTIASNSCGASLAASGVCNISIAFTPTTTGDKTATLSVADTVGTQSVSLAGTGTTSPVAQAVVSPSSASFGSITVGTTAAAKVFTLANAGNAALTINSVALSGANASAFAITANACGSSLAAGGSCAITTTFAPVSVGDFTATLSIVDTVGTQSATLTGTATAVPTAADFTIATTPPSQTTTNGGTVTYTVTVAPTGGTPFPGAVTLSATGAPAGSRITFSPATLTPGSAVATSTLTIVVPQAVATSRFAARDEPAFPRMALTFPLSFLALYLGQRRKRTVRMIATISLMLCAGAWMTGCVPPAPTTTATTSTLTITGTSGSTNHSSTVSLVVR
jgi:hypothetical protein